MTTALSEAGLSAGAPNARRNRATRTFTACDLASASLIRWTVRFGSPISPRLPAAP